MNVIRKLRVEKGLTQEELGEILNVQKAAISKYELDRAKPSPDILKKLSSFFNVTTDYLLDNDVPVNKEAFTKKETKEITHLLDEVKEKLINEQGLMFDGNPATPESVQSIIDAMQIGMEMAKKRNKEKYSPKKYK